MATAADPDTIRVRNETNGPQTGKMMAFWEYKICARRYQMVRPNGKVRGLQLFADWQPYIYRYNRKPKRYCESDSEDDENNDQN